MSNKKVNDYSNHANRSSSGKFLQERQSAAPMPDLERDRHLVAKAAEKMRARWGAHMIAVREKRELLSPRILSVKRFVDDLLRLVHDGRVLTERQRAGIMKIAHVTELPPLPEVKVAPLPKKPPGRVQEPAETMYFGREPVIVDELVGKAQLSCYPVAGDEE